MYEILALRTKIKSGSFVVSVIGGGRDKFYDYTGRQKHVTYATG